jgi:hypothetical protein
MEQDKPAVQVQPAGLGNIGAGVLPDEVYGWIRRGYPRIAYARAVGVPLAPWLFNVRHTFDTPDPQVSPVLGADSEITQDTIVDSMLVRVTIDRTPTSPFDAPSDNAFNFTNALEATLDVTGTPKYAVAPEFTPLATLMDAFNGNSKWPFCWVLNYQEGVKMQIQNRVELPDFPVTVVCTFRAWQPVTDLLVNVSTREVVAMLAALGYTIPDRYLDFIR